MIQRVLITIATIFIFFRCLADRGLNENVFARVNDDALTVEEFVYTYGPQVRFIKNPYDKDQLNYHGGRMIRNSLFAQYTEKSNMYDPLVLRDQIKEITRQAVIDEMIRVMIEDSLEMLAEEEVRDAYLKSLEYREVRHLFSPDPEKIRTWHEAILAGRETFHSISQKAFQDTFLRNHGGYLGLITYGDMVPEFEEVVFRTEPGKISEPFKTPFGWHILSVESVQTDMLPTEDDFQVNQDRIRGKIRRVKQEKFVSGFYQSLVRDRKIRPDSEGVQALTQLIITSRHTGKLLSENIMASPSEAFFEDILDRSRNIWDQPVVYVDDDYISLLDILPLLEKIPLALLYRNPSQAVLFAVRDELVYQIGLNRGLDETKPVQMKIGVRKKDWLSKRFVASLTDTLKISYPPNLNEAEKSQYAMDVKNALIHKTYLNLRENADIQTDMNKIYEYYQNLNQIGD